MKTLFASLALSVCFAIPCHAETGKPMFWLLELGAFGNGKFQQVQAIDDYETAESCQAATLVHELPEGVFFAACVPLDEQAEQALAAYIDNAFYGQTGAPRESGHSLETAILNESGE